MDLLLRPKSAVFTAGVKAEKICKPALEISGDYVEE
jgi:hypothetical protein